MKLVKLVKPKRYSISYISSRFITCPSLSDTHKGNTANHSVLPALPSRSTPLSSSGSLNGELMRDTPLLSILLFGIMSTCRYCQAIRPLIASARSLKFAPAANPIRPYASTVSSHGQVRHYAVPRMRRTGPSPLEVFNLSEIPISAVSAVIDRNGEAFKRGPAAEYYDCASRFHKAISQGSDPWSVALTGSK